MSFADFQSRVRAWVVACFGETIADERAERNHRYLEESLELVQSLGATREECLQLVEYVYSRPTGEARQEVGGSLLTLAALCSANGIDLAQSGEVELSRVLVKIEVIRASRPRSRNTPRFRRQPHDLLP